MNRIICITILCLWGFIAQVCAQTSLQELIDRMSDSDRKEYFDNARNYIENTYYNQLFATLSNRDAYAYVVEDLMAEKNVQCKPEILCKGNEQRYLSPMEYMYCLGREFRDLDTDELEFEVSNIDFSPDILPYSTLSLRVWADYDLEVRYQSRTLLKRRCRMYCLFPRYYVVTRVRLLQVEPLKDLAAPRQVFAVTESSYEARYNEALQWYEQKKKNKYLPEFRKLAEKGYTEAEWKYGHCLYDENKFSEAVYWYRRAGKKNHAKAQNDLGVCYEYGIGVNKDLKQAVQWYNKSAGLGFVLAQCNLAICYEYGIGIEKDLEQAKQWYFKAATQGYERAQIALERLNNSINITSVNSSDYNLATRYNQAVDAYRRGNDNIAYPIFKKLAEEGDKNAQCYIGLCYQLGRGGVSKSDRQALNWYNKAAGKGSADALYNLAMYYERGVCVIKDEKKAFDLYFRAATLGHSDAQYVLGLLYMCCIGTNDKDKHRKAIQWFQRAAKQEHPKAVKALKDVSYVTKPSILYMEHLLDAARGKYYSEPSKN